MRLEHFKGGGILGADGAGAGIGGDFSSVSGKDGGFLIWSCMGGSTMGVTGGGGVMVTGFLGATGSTILS